MIRALRSVDITYESSRLEPRQLQAIFEATLPLLLEVFNPQGWCVNSIHRRCMSFFAAIKTPLLTLRRAGLS
jgi:hypothetical protein